MGNVYDYTKIKYLYAEEKDHLFDIIRKDDSIHAMRNYAIFNIAEYAALRASEIGMITLDAINLQRNEIYCKRLKHSNNNTLRIIDQNVLNALYQYIDYKNEKGLNSPYLFESQKGNPISRKTIDEIMKRYCEMAGLPEDKAHFHVLKHTRAIALGEMGLDTKEVQYWLGHKSIKSTEVYLQFTTKQQELLYQKLYSSMK